MDIIRKCGTFDPTGFRQVHKPEWLDCDIEHLREQVAIRRALRWFPAVAEWLVTDSIATWTPRQQVMAAQYEDDTPEEDLEQFAARMERETW